MNLLQLATLLQPLRDLFLRLVRARMADWLVAAAVLWGLVYLIAPQQLSVSIYKIALVAIAAIVGWWVDRSLFPYARPELFFKLMPATDGKNADEETAFTDLASSVSFAEKQAAVDLQAADPGELLQLARTAMLRRAAIVAACMLAIGLGA